MLADTRFRDRGRYASRQPHRRDRQSRGRGPLRDHGGRAGVGVISAAQLLIAYSHHGRLRSEAFDALAGVSANPASSGQIVRYRLNRGGDRQFNRALHTMTISRLRHNPTTRAHASRHTAEGKSSREIKRCLKRYLAHHLFRLLNANPKLHQSPTMATP